MYIYYILSSEKNDRMSCIIHFNQCIFHPANVTVAISSKQQANSFGYDNYPYLILIFNLNDESKKFQVKKRNRLGY